MPKQSLTALDIERNKLAKNVNRRLRNLMEREDLGTSGTVKAIDKQLANIYGKPRSTVDGVSWLRAKEKGGGATAEEVAALKRVLGWKSTTITGTKKIIKETNANFRKWGYRGKTLTATQITDFFNDSYYRYIEQLLGSEQAVRIMTRVLNSPEKIEAVKEYLTRVMEVKPDVKNEFLQAIERNTERASKKNRGGSISGASVEMRLDNINRIYRQQQRKKKKK